MKQHELLDRASLLRVHSNHQAAIDLLRSSADVDECSCEVAGLLYLCLVEMDRIAEATSYLESLLASPHGNAVSLEVANHLLQSLTGSPLPEQAPHQFVSQFYDSAAATFNQASQVFQYSGPALIQGLLNDRLGTIDSGSPRLDRVLDAGCGTGQLSETLRGYAKVLEGVDLSPRMLDAAKMTQTYDHLECDDIMAYLSRSNDPFDMIVAADSFNYFGNLKPLISACFSALKTDGWLVFSLQEGPLDKDSYFLRYDGSYIHSPQYLIEQLGEAGVAGGSIRRAVIRQQFGQSIWALLVAVQRPSEI